MCQVAKLYPDFCLPMLVPPASDLTLAQCFNLAQNLAQGMLLQRKV